MRTPDEEREACCFGEDGVRVCCLGVEEREAKSDVDEDVRKGGWFEEVRIVVSIFDDGED